MYKKPKLAMKINMWVSCTILVLFTLISVVTQNWMFIGVATWSVLLVFFATWKQIKKSKSTTQ